MSSTTTSTAPILDAVLALGMIYFIFGSITTDIWMGLDIDLRTTGWELHKTIYAYGASVDPLFLQNGPYMRFSALASALVGAPLCLAVLSGLVLRREWVALPAAIHALLMFANLCVVYWLEYTGETRPYDHFKFNLTVGPYILVPVLMMWRLSSRPLFSPSKGVVGGKDKVKST